MGGLRPDCPACRGQHRAHIPGCRRQKHNASRARAQAQAQAPQLRHAPPFNSDKMVSASLPAGWALLEARSAPGRYFFFDTATGHTTWTRPTKPTEAAQSRVEREPAADASGGAANAGANASASANDIIAAVGSFLAIFDPEMEQHAKSMVELYVLDELVELFESTYGIDRNATLQPVVSKLYALHQAAATSAAAVAAEPAKISLKEVAPTENADAVAAAATPAAPATATDTTGTTGTATATGPASATG